VFVDGEEVHLTPMEYKLLRLLINNRGKVLTHNYILNQIWGYSETNDAKSLRVFMASLRRKIERDTASHRFILTQVGVGYRFVEK
jgi:two-component system KDP operon response regulator KdpE